MRLPEITRKLNATMSAANVERLRSTAHAFDVAKAPGLNIYERCGIGTCGIVQIWCVPNDKPSCWDAPLSPGAWGQSELVGEIDWQEQPDGLYELLVRVYGRALREHRQKQAREQGQQNWRQVVFSSQEEQALLDWLEQKARNLIRLAELEDHVVGLCCPYCDWVLYQGELLNGLVDHVIGNHPQVKVTGVVLSDPILLQTNQGDMPLQRSTRPAKGGEDRALGTQ